MAIENPVAARRAIEFQEKLGVSNRELARLVFVKWSESGEELPLKDADGLAVKIGQLRKGVLTWWLDYPGAVGALADVFERDVSELEIRPPSETVVHLFAFDDLPELRELDLRTDSIYVLGQPNWFSTEWFGKTTPVWIEAPAGAGKSLAAQWHAARGTASMLRVPRLIDAVFRLVDGPLVVDVESAHPESDVDALRTLRGRKQLLVLASFSPPEDEDSDTPAIKKRNPFSFEETPPPKAGFTCHQWRSEQNWRATFLGWIAKRQNLGDGWAQRVDKWIGELDPDARLFATPGALLPLLHFVWTDSPARFRKAQFVDEWLSLSIAKTATDRSPCSLWLQANGRDLVKALAEARVTDPKLPWEGGLSRAQWAELVPSTLRARLAGEAVRRELVAIAEVSPRRRTKEIEKTARRLEEPSAPEAVQYLVAARILRPVGAGSLDLHPRWTEEWHAAGHAFHVVESDASAIWGRWAVDGARRPSVDAALDQLAPAQFREVARRVLKQWDPTSLGSVGAIESLFFAVARRLNSGPSPLDMATLHDLWRIQYSLIQRREGWPPEPQTRPGLQGRVGSGPQWLACCWSWSVHVGRPKARILDEDMWLFPGWSIPRIANAPKWFEWLHLPRNEQTHDEARSWQIVLETTRSIVDRCGDTELPADVPELLFPEVLRAVPGKGWKVSSELARGIFYAGLTPSLALAAIEGLPETEKVIVARNLWNAIILEKDGDPLWWRFSERPAIFDFITKRLSEQDIREAVRLKKISFPFVDPTSEEKGRRLPLPLWEAALHELLVGEQSKQLPPHDFEGWPRWTGAIVEALIGKSPNAPAWMGIRNLWIVDPDRALRRTALAYPSDPDGLYWVSEGWRYRRDEILAFIEAHPVRPLPLWAHQWLSRNLPDTPGEGADRIYSLLVGRGGPTQAS